MINVNYLGVDMSALLASNPSEIVEIRKDSLIDNLSNVKLINKKNVFSVDDSQSILNGVTWQGEKITIDNNGDQIINGIVIDGKLNNITFDLTVQSEITKALAATVYYSEVDKTPAEAIQEILVQYLGSDYIDFDSFSAANAYYSDNNVSCSFTFNSDTMSNVTDAVNAILELGSLYCWNEDNKIKVATYSAYEAGTALTEITTQTMASTPKKIKGGNSSDIWNDYEINYIISGNISVTAVTGGNIGQQSISSFGRRIWRQDYGSGSNIRINNISSAVALGNLKLLRDRNPKERIEFIIENNKIPLFMFDIYPITYSRYGYDNKPFRLMKQNKNYSVTTCTFEEVN